MQARGFRQRAGWRCAYLCRERDGGGVRVVCGPVSGHHHCHALGMQGVRGGLGELPSGLGAVREQEQQLAAGRHQGRSL